MEGQEEIVYSPSAVIKVTQTHSRNADVGQHVVSAPTLRAEREDAQIKNDGVLGLENGRSSTTGILADKGKRVDPQEYGGASFKPKPTTVPVNANFIGMPGVIEVIGVHLNKGKGVVARKRWGGVAKYEPGPSRIDFANYSPQYGSESSAFQKQDIYLQPPKATDLNQESHYDPTFPRLRWHPKISPYRLIFFSTPLAIGTAKAISSQKGNVTVPITLEWICSIVVFLVLFLLGSYETRTDIPKHLLRLFKPDCIDIVWYLAAKLSIPRPEYLSTELDLEFDPGHLVTSYRILVSCAVLFFGSLKATFTYSNLSMVATWVEWFFAALLTSLLYLGGLYENNSLGLWSSFFRNDRSYLINMDFLGSNTSLPIVIIATFFLVILSAQWVPDAKRSTRNLFPEYIRDSQFPIGPTLSKGTMEDIYMAVVFYIPTTILYVALLVLLRVQLWGPIFASTTMLPSSLRDYTGRFFAAVKKFAQRRPIDRMIYHFVALMQLLLFVTLNAWVILQLSFVHSIFQETHKTLSTKVLFYTAPITAWMMIWHIYGWVWETRWWPSRDRLIHLLPPSMANVTMTKFIQRQVAEALCRLASSSSSHFPIILTTIYFFMTILLFFSCYGSYHTVLSGGADLPVLVTVLIFLVVSVLFWLYMTIKVFPVVFGYFLWSMRPALHYSFQDFTESIRDSIES